METMKRGAPGFSLCGLNCGLCPRFNTEAKSKCLGCDSFVSYRRVNENFREASENLRSYEKALTRRHEILERLIAGFNDGKSKGLYCLVANDMPLRQLEGLLEELERRGAGKDAREGAKLAKGLISEIGDRLGFEFKLRKG